MTERSLDDEDSPFGRTTAEGHRMTPEQRHFCFIHPFKEVYNLLIAPNQHVSVQTSVFVFFSLIKSPTMWKTKQLCYCLNVMLNLQASGSHCSCAEGGMPVAAGW